MSRDNTTLTILPSASRAVVSKSTDVENVGYRCGIFDFDFSSPTSAPTVGPTFAVEARAAGTTAAQYYAIATIGTTDSTSTGIRRIVLGPDISTADTAATAGIYEQEHVALPLPHLFRVTSTSASTGTCAYSVGVQLLN